MEPDPNHRPPQKHWVWGNHPKFANHLNNFHPGKFIAMMWANLLIGDSFSLSVCVPYWPYHSQSLQCLDFAELLWEAICFVLSIIYLNLLCRQVKSIIPNSWSIWRTDNWLFLHNRPTKDGVFWEACNSPPLVPWGLVRLMLLRRWEVCSGCWWDRFSPIEPVIFDKSMRCDTRILVARWRGTIEWEAV